MKIAVVGLWHLGTVTAACLASAGYTVLGFDQATEVTSRLQNGLLPVFEPGLEDLLRKEIQAGGLSFSSDAGDLYAAEIVWVAYDTPIDENDRADVESVLGRVAALYPHLREGTLILISSQLPVGATRRLEEAYRSVRPNGTATFAYSPENLRLGKAIEAFTRPERIVVGLRAAQDRGRIARLLKPFTEKIEWMSVESAEMTKHALNAFLATSVTFINELAALCERVGADAKEIERGLKSDTRIGPKAYLRAGGAFSGGTLARDLSFLVDMGRIEDLPVHLLSSVQLSNEAHKDWPRRRLLEVLGDLHAKTVGVLGLTYKPGTDTLRRSMAVEACRWLSRQGAAAVAYDPAVKTLPEELARFIDLRPSIEAAVRDTVAIVVATEWPEFTSLKAEQVVSWMSRPIVLDPGRFLERNLSRDKRIQYFSVGSAA